MEVQRDGSIRPEELDHRLPLKSEEAFRKYIQRVKRKGIRNALLHRSQGRKFPNRGLWTDALKFLVSKPTRTSHKEVFHDLENLMDDHPEGRFLISLG